MSPAGERADMHAEASEAAPHAPALPALCDRDRAARGRGAHTAGRADGGGGAGEAGGGGGDVCTSSRPRSAAPATLLLAPAELPAAARGRYAQQGVRPGLDSRAGCHAHPCVRLGAGLAGERCRPALRVTGRQGRQCERAAQGGVCSTSAEWSRSFRHDCPQARFANAKSWPMPPPNLVARQAGRRPWRRRQPAAACKAGAPRMASHMASVMPYRLRVGHSHRPWCWSAARTRRARCCGAPRPPRRCCRARAPRCRRRRRRR